MLTKLTEIAMKFSEINVNEVSFEAEWQFRELLKIDLIEQFSRYGNVIPHMPELDEDELDLMIYGIQFNIKSKPKIKFTLLPRKTSVADFKVNWATQMSARLCSCLTKYFKNFYIEDITWEEWYKYRGCGKITWEEFDYQRQTYLSIKDN